MHAFAPTACRRLDEDGIRQGVGLGEDVVMAAHHAEGNGDAMFDGDLASFDLVAHESHDVGIGADEDEVVGLAGFCQFGALREEAVAGVYGVGT